VIRGVNVFPSAIEAVVLDDPALAGHYALVVDRRGVLPNLEVHCELASAEGDRDDVSRRIVARLEQRLRLRVDLRLAGPGAIPRQEVGKAKRVFDRIGDADPF
jgi:phenylacetate-CoA ligase